MDCPERELLLQAISDREARISTDSSTIKGLEASGEARSKTARLIHDLKSSNSRLLEQTIGLQLSLEIHQQIHGCYRFPHPPEPHHCQEDSHNQLWKPTKV